MSLIQGNASKVNTTAFYTKTIDQSLRFEDGDSAYLTFDPAADGNKDNWSLSFWFKRANLGLTQLLFGQGTNGSNNRDIVYIAADDTLEVASYGGAYVFRYITTQKFRDPSAWYHLVISYQSGDATASDRLRIYLNGERITAFSTSTDPSLNADSAHFNSGSPQYIGKYIDQSGSYLDGYMAEVHFTDGTAYQASTFGELKSGIWIPKDPSVTYGTNGFKLTFADSAAIGDDTSGEGNDWTVNNLVASDVVPDSPTNNFATFNPLHSAGNQAEGNLKTTAPGTNWYTALVTQGITSGKWYAEFYYKRDGAGYAFIGVAKVAQPQTINAYLGEAAIADADSYGYYSLNGSIYNQGAQTAYGNSYTNGDVIGLALDMDAGNLYFYKNGTIQNSGTAAATGLTGAMYIGATSFSTSDHIHFNAGQDSTFAGNLTAGGNSDDNGIGDFKYTVPSGYLALCTSNLPDPAIDPAQDDPPENYMDVLTYTGDGSSSNEINGLNFQPDWVWIKARNVSRSHVLFDSVRGVTLRLRSDGTAVESDLGGDTLLSFDSDGFTYGADTTGNGSGDSFVAWNWKAGTAVSGSTTGAGTSKSYSGSVNTTSGFSIIAYEGNGTAGHTIPHHLNSAPEIIIIKNRDDADNWAIYHANNTTAPETEYLRFTANITADDNRFWNDTAPSTSVVTLGTIDWLNFNGHNNIMYCFHSVEQFSKCGLYIGNGNANGSFVYTGFRPKFLLTKNVTGATADWRIYDSERLGYNASQYYLVPNTSNAEVASTEEVDFLSNGFKCRDTDTALNTNNVQYIYLAFAEQPFKYSNAR